MWPFKRQAIPDFKDVVQDYPAAPCGHQYEHYFWKEIHGFPCPKCAAIADLRKKAEHEERLAELIAAKVVEKMKGGSS